MHVKARNTWTATDCLSVAGLIVNPGSNGGTASDLTAQDVAAALPDTPAFAVFDGERAVFTVALHPYDHSIPRGILHVAGTGEYPQAWRLVKAFMDALPGVDILTFTQDVRLIRLGRMAGLQSAGEMNGYTVLVRT